MFQHHATWLKPQISNIIIGVLRKGVPFLVHGVKRRNPHTTLHIQPFTFHTVMHTTKNALALLRKGVNKVFELSLGLHSLPNVIPVATDRACSFTIKSTILFCAWTTIVDRQRRSNHCTGNALYKFGFRAYIYFFHLHSIFAKLTIKFHLT